MISRYLTVHGMDWRAWAKCWDLEPVTAPCTDCGAERTTTVPIATRLLRGLASPPCVCGGQSRTPYCVVAARGDLFQALTGLEAQS